jgi:hypothetical protein
MAIEMKLSSSSDGASALVKRTARTLAARLASLVRLKLAMFSSSRLKACTSRTPEMDSCSPAFTEPISIRLCLKALRARSDKNCVATSIKGSTVSESSAYATFWRSICTTSQTISSTPPATWTSPKLMACWMVSTSFVSRLITSPASCTVK